MVVAAGENMWLLGAGVELVRAGPFGADVVSKGENASSLACKSCNTDLSISMYGELLDIYVATVWLSYVHYSVQTEARPAMVRAARIGVWEGLSYLS